MIDSVARSGTLPGPRSGAIIAGEADWVTARLWLTGAAPILGQNHQIYRNCSRLGR